MQCGRRRQLRCVPVSYGTGPGGCRRTRVFQGCLRGSNVTAVTPSTTVHRPQRLYGRSGELAVLDAMLTRLAAGTGGTLVLTAPPGLGRSALVPDSPRTNPCAPPVSPLPPNSPGSPGNRAGRASCWPGYAPYPHPAGPITYGACSPCATDRSRTRGRPCSRQRRCSPVRREPYGERPAGRGGGCLGHGRRAGLSRRDAADPGEPRRSGAGAVPGGHVRRARRAAGDGRRAPAGEHRPVLVARRPPADDCRPVLAGQPSTRGPASSPAPARSPPCPPPAAHPPRSAVRKRRESAHPAPR